MTSFSTSLPLSNRSLSHLIKDIVVLTPRIDTMTSRQELDNHLTNIIITTLMVAFNER